MRFGVSALVGVIMLLGMGAAIVMAKKRQKPVFLWLAVACGVLGALVLLYCAATLILVAAVD